ncbi:hypothetical protein DPEC_G00267590 [Dallia pectoralis]|uniref:Uncharacterized protein n=1 Tax=Dallia pectoralis TaxID=75939 RepID=A0ACC2FP14_DALPE|nr:hypothetical protein DPEC_G00267590 [Dallia pectoralis]
MGAEPLTELAEVNVVKGQMLGRPRQALTHASSRLFGSHRVPGPAPDQHSRRQRTRMSPARHTQTEPDPLIESSLSQIKYPVYQRLFIPQVETGKISDFCAVFMYIVNIQLIHINIP